MTTTYTLPGCRRKLRTSATRQYLIVSVLDGRPKVETSTDDEDAAAFAAGAPGFRRTVVVADSGHSVQGDQPLRLIEILREELG